MKVKEEQWSDDGAFNRKRLDLLVRDFMEAGELASADDRNCDWMLAPLSKHLERSEEEIKALRDDIVRNVKAQEQSRERLQKAKSFGLSRESWLEQDLKKSASFLAQEKMGTYFQRIDDTIRESNDLLADIIHTESGEINQNPNLDGNLAEGYHASTFNIDAAARDSDYHAEVPQGNGKNSVDILVKDGDGKVVGRYQSKYYSNAEKTEGAFRDGDYRGQQKLVPSDQQDQIDAKTTDRIQTDDGTQSKPLSKTEAKQMQQEAQQSGQSPELDWDDVSLSSVAKSIASQSAKAGLLGGVISASVMTGSSLLKGEEIDGKEIAKEAVKTGASTAAKNAASGALVVAMEKGLISGVTVSNELASATVNTVVKRGSTIILTSSQAVCAASAIVAVGIDTAKAAYDVAQGDISLQEAVDRVQDSAAATAGGIVGSLKGASVGATFGAALGPIGVAVGGFVGSIVGGIAGSTVGRAISVGSRKVRDAMASAAKTVASGALNVAKSAVSAVSGLFSSIFG